MHKVRPKRKRSKTLIILMLPALIFIGFMGWLMYAMGSHKANSNVPRKTPKKSTNDTLREDGVVFVPVDLEEEKVISK